MELREELMSYNDISFSEEEVKDYEEAEVSDEVLRSIKDRVGRLCCRANFSEGLSKVENEFEKDEKVQKTFVAESYGVSETKILTGMVGSASFAAGVWTDWGTKTIIILTNKRIFIVYANDAFGFLKIKRYKFDEIQFIRSIKYDKKFIILGIKPVNEREIKMNIYNNKYVPLLNYVRDNIPGIEVVDRDRTFREKAPELAAWIILILILIFGLILTMNMVVRSPYYK